MKTKPILALLAVFALAAPAASALAQPKAVDFSNAGRNEVFKDLPGVIPTEEDEARKKVVCVQVFDPEAPTGKKWPKRGALVYSCTQNGLTYQSNRSPYSRDREMRGIPW